MTPILVTIARLNTGARALGLSTQRLMALVEQVVTERNNARDLQRRRRLAAQPIE